MLGVVITVTTAVLLSLITGGRQQAQHIKPEYLHPLVRPKLLNDLDECVDEDENDNKEEKFEMTTTTST